MPARLYLDTARLGLMSKAVRLALRDFAQLAGEEGASLYFDNFLRDGYDRWPSRLRRRYKALRHWQGVSADRVLFFDHGVILEEGPPDQIFTSPEHDRTREFLTSILEA